jgi:hypothetical protein
MRGSSEYMDILMRRFEEIQNERERVRSALLHLVRESIRDLLSQHDTAAFPRFGQHLISLDDLVSTFGLNRQLRLKASTGCPSCGTLLATPQNTSIDLYYFFCSGTIHCLGTPIPATVTVQDWISAQLAMEQAPTDHVCVQCRHTLDFLYIPQETWPPILVFNPNPMTNTCLVPSLSLSIPNPPGTLSGNYRLSAILYSGNAHFTARIRTGVQWWEYDGMHARPLPFCIENRINAATLMTMLAQRGMGIPTHYVYTLVQRA